MFKKLIFIAALITCTPVFAYSTQDVWDVQGKANMVLTYREDDEDTWRIPNKRGDCEDFALWKRAELLKLGFKPEELKVQVVIKPKNKISGNRREAHVVLLVVPYNLVLDNFERFPMNYNEWLHKYNLTEFCEAVNFQEKMRLQDRCAKAP